MALDARYFFENVLPTMVEQGRDAFLKLRGIIAFDIKGVGQWTVGFGVMPPVTEGLDPAAGVTLACVPAAFAHFVEGTLDVGKAVSTRAISARGDELELIEQFAGLLHPPPADLGWDISPSPKR